LPDCTLRWRRMSPRTQTLWLVGPTLSLATPIPVPHPPSHYCRLPTHVSASSYDGVPMLDSLAVDVPVLVLLDPVASPSSLAADERRRQQQALMERLEAKHARAQRQLKRKQELALARQAADQSLALSAVRAEVSGVRWALERLMRRVAWGCVVKLGLVCRMPFVHVSTVLRVSVCVAALCVSLFPRWKARQSLQSSPRFAGCLGFFVGAGGASCWCGCFVVVVCLYWCRQGAYLVLCWLECVHVRYPDCSCTLCL
jgi:hypothetical protein